MDNNKFWTIIEESKKQNNQVEYIIEYLSKYSLDEIIQFEIAFNNQMDISYTSSLWGAAYIIMGGCSDDSFDYFRGWLIAQGKSVFYETIKNPEYLVEYIPEYYRDEELIPELEEILSVAQDAFTYNKTGSFEYDDKLQDEFFDILEQSGYEWKKVDIEFDWEEDDLEEMFPKLWSRFGEEPLEC